MLPTNAPRYRWMLLMPLLSMATIVETTTTNATATEQLERGSSTNVLKSSKNNTLIPLKKQCVTIAADQLRRLCTERYPKELKIKYKDQLVQPGALYSVFIPRFLPDGFFNYMVTFLPSGLHTCTLIKINHQNQIDCLQSGRPVNINLKKSLMHCLDFHVQIVVDLVQYCMEHQRGFGWNSETRVMLNMSMFHYNYLGPSDGGTKLVGAVGVRVCFVIIWVLMVMLVMRHFSGS